VALNIAKERSPALRRERAESGPPPCSAHSAAPGTGWRIEPTWSQPTTTTAGIARVRSHPSGSGLSAPLPGSMTLTASRRLRSASDCARRARSPCGATVGVRVLLTCDSQGRSG